MDKNTTTALILFALVLIGFNWFNQPSKEEIEQMRQQDSIAQVEKLKAEQQAQEAKKNAQKQAEEARKAAAADTTAAFHTALAGTASDIVLKNEKLELTLSTKGATVTKAVVKGFKDREENADVTLFDEKDQQLKFMLAGKDINIITSDLFFNAEDVSDSTVTFTAEASQGKVLKMTYKLGPDYMLHASLRAASRRKASRLKTSGRH